MAGDPFRYGWASYGFTLSSRLRRLRLMRGLSQARLAELAGLSRTIISNLERNHYNYERSADPTLSTLYRIARGLHVPPAVLLPGAVHTVEEICPAPPPMTRDDDVCETLKTSLQWPACPEDTARFHHDYLLAGKPGQLPRFEGPTHTG